MFTCDNSHRLSNISILKNLLDLSIIEKKDINFPFIESDDEWNSFIFLILSKLWDEVEQGTINSEDDPYFSYIKDEIYFKEIEIYNVHYLVLKSKLLIQHRNLVDILSENLSKNELQKFHYSSNANCGTLYDYINAIIRDFNNDFPIISDFDDECYKIIVFSYNTIGSEECLIWSYYLKNTLIKSINNLCEK